MFWFLAEKIIISRRNKITLIILISFDIFLQHTEFQSLFEWRHIWNEQICYVFSSNQILWDPCYGVVYPTWEYIESYGTYKWHHVHIWQGVQCIHQMSLYILLSFPLTFNHIRISETPPTSNVFTPCLYIFFPILISRGIYGIMYGRPPQRPMYSPHISIYSSQFLSTEAYIWNHVCLYAYMLHVCRYAYICFWKSKFHINMDSCMGDPSVQCIRRTSLYPHPAFFVSHNICLCDIFVSSL